jgi:hypothetical protein
MPLPTQKGPTSSRILRWCLMPHAKLERGGLACRVGEGSGRARRAERVRRSRRPCPKKFTVTSTYLINIEVTLIPATGRDLRCAVASMNQDMLQLNKKRGAVCCVPARVYSALPTLPYDPGEQGDPPLHAEDPAEREDPSSV